MLYPEQRTLGTFQTGANGFGANTFVFATKDVDPAFGSDALFGVAHF
jgi:hypothetical protein